MEIPTPPNTKREEPGFGEARLRDWLIQIRQTIQYVKGVGPHRALILKRLDIETVEDLLYHLPREFQDRSSVTPVSGFREDQFAFVTAKVLKTREAHPKSAKVRLVLEAVLDDGTGTFAAVWFNQKYLAEHLKTGLRVVLHGQVERCLDGWLMSAPEVEILGDEAPLPSLGVLPIYPLCEGLNQKAIRKIILEVLKKFATTMPDPLPSWIIERHSLISFSQALRWVHWPAGMPGESFAAEWRENHRQALRRLAYDDLFRLQLGLSLRRSTVVQETGIIHRIQTPARSVIPAVPADGLTARFIRSLPFSLTSAQLRAITEIENDMSAQAPMQRLLQGDVGSGKTVVFLYGMLLAVENGMQAAVMAPTEVLAEQHYQTVTKLTKEIPVSIGLLHGGLPASEARRVREATSKGEIDLLIGTHALFQDKTEFSALSFVVVDEQHKFGVAQRASLQAKGGRPDTLITSATPIPRTLALTLYGDLDVSILDEKPPGRKPVKTYWVPEHKRMDAYRFIEEQIGKGAQVYVIAPLIEESEKLPTLVAVAERYQHLAETVFPHRNVALLHGKLPSIQKQVLLGHFSRGEIDVLVSTTVVEVGMDVPKATIMLIESAERFGLSQLHQLRGRVGRGSDKSYCFLLTGETNSENSRKRIQSLVRTEDGFEIAEADLQIRGPGELMGYRQSGELGFRVADLLRDQELLTLARKDAMQLVEKDRGFSLPEHALLKIYWNALPKRETLGIG